MGGRCDVAVAISNSSMLQPLLLRCAASPAADVTRRVNSESVRSAPSQARRRINATDWLMRTMFKPDTATADAQATHHSSTDCRVSSAHRTLSESPAVGIEYDFVRGIVSSFCDCECRSPSDMFISNSLCTETRRNWKSFKGMSWSNRIRFDRSFDKIHHLWCSKTPHIKSCVIGL